jgi:HipA-like protein
MSKKKAEIFYNNLLAGYLIKSNGKYRFEYAESYLNNDKCPPISLTFPKSREAFESNVLFPFFYGLLSEGQNKELQCRLLQIDEDDHFTRLLKTANENTIGGVTVKEVE